MNNNCSLHAKGQPMESTLADGWKKIITGAVVRYARALIGFTLKRFKLSQAFIRLAILSNFLVYDVLNIEYSNCRKLGN